jgi:hypothetical protein
VGVETIVWKLSNGERFRCSPFWPERRVRDMTFALVFPPDPLPAVTPSPPLISKKERRRQRQRELANVDPEHDILPLELTGPAYAHYRNRLLARDSRCFLCRQPVKENTATLDHAIIPRSKGGLNCPWNLVLTCERCNTAKADRGILEWYHDLRRACQKLGLIDDDDSDTDDFVSVHAGDPLASVGSCEL